MEKLITIENLEKTFNGANPSEVLRGVNLTVYRGQSVGIIGASGAGKSTLIRCINRLETPTGGKILFKGENVFDFNDKRLRAYRRKTAMVFQSFNLFEQRNALKNVAYALEIAGVKKTEAKKRALEALKLVGLEDKANSYPSQLSGGQKQRDAIARSLVSDPEVLLLDEATSALDPDSTTELVDLLLKLKNELKLTLIVVTHEMDVACRLCDKTAILKDGKIVDFGDTKDILNRPIGGFKGEITV